ncbi:MAG TPA: hypothetical protein VGS57_03925 [Thermoanaerobaculia bacterium]|jgi:hypothetical protein|nr:hypothetical protein [Thermoanaerobaculia bacterium]
MFLGHFAVGLAAKRVAPRVSLGTLFAAAQLADLLWPVFLLVHAEHVLIRPGATAATPLVFTSYPYSHSLAALAVWAALFAAGYAAIRRHGWTAPLVLFALVLSHWVLDWVMHVPDLPLTLTGPARLGLGVWRSLPLTLALELLTFAAGTVIYLRATAPRDRIGRIGLYALLTLLLLIYFASVFGPPPPSDRAIAWSGIGMWLLVAWGAWVDRHREEPSR